MGREYWIVNLETNEYFQIVDDGKFFDDDWKLQTPWPTTSYLFLSAQSVHPDQVFEKGAFYGYDLCREGMIVGVYYDTSVHSRANINAHVKKLKRRNDVARVYVHPLKQKTLPV